MGPTTSCRLALLAAVVASACTEGPTDPVLSAEGPPTIAADWRDGVVGWAGQAMPLGAFVSRGGTPLSNVAIEWRVSSGEGLFRVAKLDQTGGWELAGSMTNSTGANGVALAMFVATVEGHNVVTASATTAQGVVVGAADFATTATDVLITVGDVDWEASWSAGPQDVSVAVGTPIHWAVSGDDWWTEDWQVRSTSEPAGGERFDSSIPRSGQPFAFAEP